MRYRRLAVAAAAVLGLPFATLTPASASTACASSGGTTIADCGFESPYLGTGPFDYQYNPSGSAWTFTGNSGISGNDSYFTYLQVAPEGNQVAFLQASTVNGHPDGRIEQSFSGWDGTVYYTLVLSEATRKQGACGLGCSDGSSSSYEVQLDGTPIAPATQVTSTTYTDHTYTFTVPSGAHTLSLAALPGSTPDTTTFIDDLRLTRTYTAADCKDGGWQTIGTYKNQGDCVSFYATGGQNAAG